jgi:hypothetical protein
MPCGFASRESWLGIGAASIASTRRYSSLGRRDRRTPESTAVLTLCVLYDAADIAVEANFGMASLHLYEK